MNYSLIAKKLFKEAEWIEGDGRFALVSRCRGVTVSLWESLEAATNKKSFIDKIACGGACVGDHEIIVLNTFPRNHR